VANEFLKNLIRKDSLLKLQKFNKLNSTANRKKNQMVIYGNHPNQLNRPLNSTNTTKQTPKNNPNQKNKSKRTPQNNCEHKMSTTTTKQIKEIAVLYFYIVFMCILRYGNEFDCPN
jgi:hypothetical protein